MLKLVLLGLVLFLIGARLRMLLKRRRQVVPVPLWSPEAKSGERRRARA